MLQSIRSENPAFGLKSQLLVLMIGLMLITSFSVTFLNFRLTQRMAREVTESALISNTRFNSDRIQTPLHDMEQAAEVLADTPQIAAMIAADQLRNMDAIAVARAQLLPLFSTFLRNRPYYAQIQFISVTGRAQELARVGSYGGNIQITATQDLQFKGREPYMQPLLSGQKRDGFFSEISLNREHGNVQANATPMIRYVRPVLGPNGEIAGALVLNADFRALLDRSFPRIQPDFMLTVLTPQGDYLNYYGNDRETALWFSGAPDWTPSVFEDLVALEPNPKHVTEIANVIAYSVGFPVKMADGIERFHVISSVNQDVFSATSTRSLVLNLQLAFAILGVTAMMALMAGRLTVQRVDGLISEIKKNHYLSDIFPSRHGHRDELGFLSNAISDISSALSDNAEKALAFIYAADGMIVTDEDGQILNVNPAVTEMFGYQSHELVDENLDILFPDDSRDPHETFLGKASDGVDQTAMAKNLDIFATRADGHIFPVEVTISHLTSDGKGYFVSAVRNITQRKQAEAQQANLVTSLKAAKAELERSNSELDGFAHIASHDLKAPLRVIDNAARWIEEDLSPTLDAETRDNLELLRSRVRRMEKLLDDLMWHSRIGREETHYTEISGDALMQGVFRLLDKPDTFQIDISPDMSGIRIPDMPITTVLANLLSNAIKHHDRPDGRVQVDVADQGDRFEFAIWDDGPGIAEKYQDVVFKMFQTLKPRDQVEGSGMGLALVKKTVEVQGGKITLSSKQGQGCLFTFTWPKAIRSGQVLDQASPSTAQSA